MRKMLLAVLLGAALVGSVNAMHHDGAGPGFVLWQSTDGRNWLPVGFFPTFDECQYARTLYTGVCLPNGRRP